MEQRNIDSYFKGILEDIQLIKNDDFYSNKESLDDVEVSINNWYSNYKTTGTLKNISSDKLKDLDLTITTFFSDYIETESVKNNYSERLLYDFGKLEHYWKDEILGRK